jgi:hypothetical protein
VLLPGRSLAGKSTLTLALVEAGATYYSDEYALIDPDGLVSPFPRPLRMRQPDGTFQEIPPPEPVATQALPVGLVAHLGFDPVAGLEVRPMTPAQTTLALIDNALPAQTRPTETLHACAAIARTARGVAGTRGDAGEAAAFLLDLLGRP